MDEKERPSVDNLKDKRFSSLEEAVAEIAAIAAGDPGSASYQREIVRPKISIVKALLNVVIPVVTAFLICLSLWFLQVEFFIIVLTGCLLLTAYFFVRIKSVAIWLIKVYQATAPESVRRKCRFEPSCSSYAISAFEKYGFFKGTAKTYRRLKRCRPPNGGFDPLE